MLQETTLVGDALFVGLCRLVTQAPKMRTSREVRESLVGIDDLTFRWTRQGGPDGNGWLAYTGFVHPRTGEIVEIGVIERTSAPKHRHDGHEIIIGGQGGLGDVDDTGRAFELTPGQIHVHRDGTIHQPAADFWVGVYRQLRGRTIIRPGEAP